MRLFYLAIFSILSSALWTFLVTRLGFARPVFKAKFSLVAVYTATGPGNPWV